LICIIRSLVMAPSGQLHGASRSRNIYSRMGELHPEVSISRGSEDNSLSCAVWVPVTSAVLPLSSRSAVRS